MKRLYLMRHGETEMNRKGCYCGWTDCELSQNGIRQAMLLRHAFEDISIDAVISSDLKRSIDTANIIAINKGIELQTDRRLRELNFGAWEGKHYTEIMENYKENWENWTKDWQSSAPLQGESFTEMRFRVKNSIDEIIEKNKDKDVLIVAHQGVLRIIITYLLNISEDNIWNFHFEHGAYSVLELHDNHCIVQSINKI